MSTPTSREPPQVLVIEDEADINHLLVGHLQRLGYRVSSARTGERGLALAAAEQPDVVLVDMLLPGIDGREVIRRLRADRRTDRCAIVVCSVLDRAELSDVSGDRVLGKPFSRAQLTRVIRSVTNGGGYDHGVGGRG